MWLTSHRVRLRLPESVQGCITVDNLQLAAFSGGAQAGAACCAEAEQLPCQPLHLAAKLLSFAAGLIKSPALRGGARDVALDERVAVGYEILAMSTTRLLRLIYPVLYPVADPSGPWGRPGEDGR